MLRKYTISIQPLKNAAQIADNVMKEFACEISDPSIYLSPGSTNKGLTFLDAKGNQLESSIFKNQAYFEMENLTQATEESAVEKLVYSLLFEHYQFGKDDVKIMVTAQ